MIGIPATLPLLFHARVAATGEGIALREWIPAHALAMPWATWREWLEASLDAASMLDALYRETA